MITDEIGRRKGLSMTASDLIEHLQGVDPNLRISIAPNGINPVPVLREDISVGTNQTLVIDTPSLL
jgi:hypothetical protein